MRIYKPFFWNKPNNFITLILHVARDRGWAVLCFGGGGKMDEAAPIICYRKNIERLIYDNKES